MTRRAKILAVIGCLAFVCLVAGVLYQKEIRIAYHRNRMWAAAENYLLLSPDMAQAQPRKPTLFEHVKFSVFRMTGYKEVEAMEGHQRALIDIGHLERKSFILTNRGYTAWSNAWPSFYMQVSNTFGKVNESSYCFPETNRFEVIATPADMPKWEKLISDFDR